MPGKKGDDSTSQIPETEYGVHFGEMVRDYIRHHRPDLSQRKIAALLDMSATGFNSKLAAPSYGNIYDLIRISIQLEYDFISPAIAIIRSKGVEVHKFYTDKEYDQVTRALERLERENDRKTREIDMLYQLHSLKSDDEPG